MNACFLHKLEAELVSLRRQLSIIRPDNDWVQELAEERFRFLWVLHEESGAATSGGGQATGTSGSKLVLDNPTTKSCTRKVVVPKCSRGPTLGQVHLPAA